jgi:hypothetical protein
MNRSGHRTSRLWVSLARVACDLDDLVDDLTAEPLSDPDGDLLAAPAMHLDLANDRLQDALYQLEKLDRRAAWSRHAPATSAPRDRTH